VVEERYVGVEIFEVVVWSVDSYNKVVKRLVAESVCSSEV
jgi:hypothetical protein